LSKDRILTNAASTTSKIK